MKLNDFARQTLAARRQRKKLLAEGYVETEPHWEIVRGAKTDYEIIDAQISADGRTIFTKIAKRTTEEAAPEFSKKRPFFWMLMEGKG